MIRHKVFGKQFLIILLFFSAFEITGQIKEIGLPFITNYSRKIYQAETQNWDITQDSAGVMYYANNGGVLSFNGSEWQLYPLPNGAFVRSIASINGRIYAGAFNEFGYFQKDEYGIIRYHSLSKDLPAQDRNFDEIWRIYDTKDGIVFQSYLNLFVYSNQEITTFEPRSRFGFSYLIDGAFYIVDREFGLYTLDDMQIQPVILNDSFFAQNEIPYIMKRDSFVFGTTNNGIFIIENNKIIPWKAEINNHLVKNQIFTMLKINEQQIAVGTIQDGLFIIDLNGKVILHMNRAHGIQNNTVLSLYYDKNENLWLGLDNGIDMLETHSPITMLNYSSNIETSYSSIIHNNILYIGTNQGLFAKPYQKLTNNALQEGGFQRIRGTLGQVWKLEVIDGKLFCGHNSGTFLIDNFKATQISSTAGGWDFLQVPWDKETIIGGTYNGLTLYKKNTKTGSWDDQGIISGIRESCKELYFDEHKNLWIIHGLKGVFKVNLFESFTSIKELQVFNPKNGLPKLPYSMVRIKDRLLLLANDSLFSYQEQNNMFVYEPEYTKIISGIEGLTRIVADKSGDLWFFTHQNMGVLRLMEDGNYIKISHPFYRLSSLYLRAPFENIYSLDANNTLIGSQEGAIHYSLDYIKNYEKDFNTYFTEIKTRSRNNNSSEKSDEKATEQNISLYSDGVTIPYRSSSVSFRFYAPFYEANNEIKYAYYLEGFENAWSDWSNLTFKEYTNLDEGDYTFMVKARNIFNEESTIRSYKFTVTPPFYRSQLAYSIYAIAILTLGIFNILYFNKKIEKTRGIEQNKLVIKEKEFEKKVAKSTEKIIELEKEKIDNEMRLKTIELANSTMNLVQKNKLLNKIKNDLTSVSERAKINSVKTDINGLITKIDKDINNDNNLKLFDKYFDRVHQDFINRIKEKHPNLTPKDLRLCAYLRMNLSTKEIAPLMNISIRGLEISRYRLRKKLELDHNANLVDYMMNI